jgi:hypothetical protein
VIALHVKRNSETPVSCVQDPYSLTSTTSGKCFPLPTDSVDDVSSRYSEWGVACLAKQTGTQRRKTERTDANIPQNTIRYVQRISKNWKWNLFLFIKKWHLIQNVKQCSISTTCSILNLDSFCIGISGFDSWFGLMHLIINSSSFLVLGLNMLSQNFYCQFLYCLSLTKLLDKTWPQMHTVTCITRQQSDKHLHAKGHATIGRMFMTCC